MGNNNRIKQCFLVGLVGIACFLGSIESAKAYDLDAGHDVNQDIDVDATKKTIWNALRKDGYSEHATAGIMGNMETESGYNYTSVQGGNDWAAWIGTEQGNATGLGLVQWSHIGKKTALFTTADEMGKQWNNLDVQLASLLAELASGTWFTAGGTCATLDDFKNLDDYMAATKIFVDGYERPNPAYAHYDRRYNSAKAALEQFSGTAVEGSNPSSSGGGASDAKAIISEWDLKGMPTKSGFLTAIRYVELPAEDSLTAKEGYSLQKVKENMELKKEFGTIDFIRRAVVFSGLAVIVYMVLLIAAYLFDRANIFFEMSLLKVISFGTLQPVEDKETIGKKGFVNGTKLAKITLSSMAVSFIIISGAVYVWLSDVYLFIGELLS